MTTEQQSGEAYRQRSWPTTIQSAEANGDTRTEWVEFGQVSLLRAPPKINSTQTKLYRVHFVR